MRRALGELAYGLAVDEEKESLPAGEALAAALAAIEPARDICDGRLVFMLLGIDELAQRAAERHSARRVR